MSCLPVLYLETSPWRETTVGWQVHPCYTCCDIVLGFKFQSELSSQVFSGINCCSRPSHVCVDVRLKQKRRRWKQNKRSGESKLARVVRGMEEWVFISEVCLNISVRLGKTNVQSCEECRKIQWPILNTKLVFNCYRGEDISSLFTWILMSNIVWRFAKQRYACLPLQYKAGVSLS